MVCRFLTSRSFLSVLTGAAYKNGVTFSVKSAAPQSERSDRLAAFRKKVLHFSCGSADGVLSCFVLSHERKNE